MIFFCLGVVAVLIAKQPTDSTVVKANNEDPEKAAASSSIMAQPDPFMLRDGLKTGPQLAELRKRRKTGKRVEKYHRRQNDVCNKCYIPPDLIDLNLHSFS